MKTGEAIRFFRKRRGLTQKELSKKANISEIALRKYELGTLRPKKETIDKIANALDMDYIYKEDGEAMFCYRPVTLQASDGDTIYVTSHEHQLLGKYRCLDSYGQETVNYILDRETNRIAALKEKDARIADLENHCTISSPKSK